MTKKRPLVADIRARKAAGEKLSMLYVSTLEEATAADAAGIDMLSIEGRFFSSEMREAAGSCFVQVGLPYGAYGTFQGKHLVAADDYMAAAYHYALMGADCFYCAASYDIQKAMCDNHIPIVAHVGLIPSYVTWTGYRAVGKTVEEAKALWRHVKHLEVIGCFGAELEVVPDRVGEWISKHTTMIMLGMGAGPGADAQYLFAEDVLGYTRGHRPRHAKTYRNFAEEYERLQADRVAAFQEFKNDVGCGAYPQPQHCVPINDDVFETFVRSAESGAS
ncbi:3-methyl-2-oxobutanoate hydroxymethyltransferase [Rhizobium leguminosarum]